ncbi:MAG TPA: DotU family type IV/VI secretion system protein, partial [Tepidisphaeraceae bacterium]
MAIPSRSPKVSTGPSALPRSIASIAAIGTGVGAPPGAASGALADEIFLNTEWEGRSYWVSNLLETKIYQTHAAGELFFQKLERLLLD